MPSSEGTHAAPGPRKGRSRLGSPCDPPIDRLKSCDGRLLVPHSSQGRDHPSPFQVGRSGVSRHFKYKTAEALAIDARDRGLDIRLRADLTPLAVPIEIAGRT